MVICDSLIHLNNLITGSNNLELRKGNVRPAGIYRSYMDWYNVEFAIYAFVIISMIILLQRKTSVKGF